MKAVAEPRYAASSKKLVSSGPSGCSRRVLRPSCGVAVAVNGVGRDENQGSRNATSKPTALGPSRNKLLTAYVISNLEGR